MKKLEKFFEFNRYVNGVLMAEGVTITKASSLDEACAKAAALASRGPSGEIPVLVLCTDTLAAELLEARATIREMALQTLSDAGQMADLQDEVGRPREAIEDQISRAHAVLAKS